MTTITTSAPARWHYTDYEATLVLLAVVRSELEPHSPQFRRELEEYPEFKQVFARHTPGSVSLRWNDFRTALSPNLKPTKGARLSQVRRMIKDWEWLTGLSVRDDLTTVAA